VTGRVSTSLGPEFAGQALSGGNGQIEPRELRRDATMLHGAEVAGSASSRSARRAARRQGGSAATGRQTQTVAPRPPRDTPGFQRTGGLPWAITTQSNPRSRGRRHFSRSALARLACKIAPERRPSPKGMRVGPVTTQIVVSGRIVAVQRSRPSFAL
jgi:hypothetical protein